MQYGMFYVHRCEQSGGQESVQENGCRICPPAHPNTHLCTSLVGVV